MPNLKNLHQKSFTKSQDNLLNVRRGEILYREDLTTGFAYALFGIAIAVAVVGGTYTIGKKLLS